MFYMAECGSERREIRISIPWTSGHCVTNGGYQSGGKTVRQQRW